MSYTNLFLVLATSIKYAGSVVVLHFAGCALVQDGLLLAPTCNQGLIRNHDYRGGHGFPRLQLK